MKPARIILAAVVLLGVSIGGYLLWQRLTSAQGTQFMAALVVRGDIEETVLGTGTLKPVRLVAVGVQASGDDADQG